MKGIILKFTGESPFYGKNILVNCTDFSTLEETIQKYFDDEVCMVLYNNISNSPYPYQDRANGNLSVGGTFYRFMYDVVDTVL